MSVTKKTTSDPAGIWELDDSQLLVRMWMMSDSKLITRPTPIESEGLKLVSEDCDLRKMEMNMKMRMTLKDDEFNQLFALGCGDGEIASKISEETLSIPFSGKVRIFLLCAHAKKEFPKNIGSSTVVQYITTEYTIT
ncbi:hypothetical protein Tco_0612926 [Tanacetum coccineum]